MSYIYRLEDNFRFLYHGKQRTLDYLPVNKVKTYKKGAEIFIYIRNDRGSGIFAIGKTQSDRTCKSSEIPKEERDNLLARNRLQIKIKINSWSVIPFIDEKYLIQFPSFNSKHVNVTLNLFTLYWAGSLAWEYKYLQYRFDYMFRGGEPFFGDNFWRFALHLLREKDIKYFYNMKLPKEQKKCFECGLQSEDSAFLEIHDSHIIRFNYYKPVTIEDFIVLCPNCHKKNHNKIKNINYKYENFNNLDIEEYDEIIYENKEFSIKKIASLKDFTADIPYDYIHKLEELKKRNSDESLEKIIFRCWDIIKEYDIDKINFDGDGPYKFKDAAHGVYGYIDIDLNMVIEAKYAYAGDFYNGYAVVSNDVDRYEKVKAGSWLFIDQQGNEYNFKTNNTPKQYTIVRDNSDNTFCVSDLKAAGIIEEFPKFYGLPPMKEEDREFGGYWGYCNNEGSEIIKPQYIYAESFCNGLAQVCKGKWEKKEFKHNQKTWTEYVSETELWGVIDKTGKEIIPCIYELISPMLIDEKPMRFYDFFGFGAKTNQDLLMVKHNGKFGIINYKNEWVVEPQFTGMDCFMSEDGLILFSDEEVDYNPDALFGVYSIPEKRIIIEPKYTEINFLKNSYLHVEENLQKRIIDRNGNVVLPLNNSEIEPERKDIQISSDNGKRGLTTITGEIILPADYDEIDVSEGLIIAQKNEVTEFYKVSVKGINDLVT